MSNIDLLIASKFKNPPLGAALLGLDGLEAAFSRAIADIYPTVTVSGNPISITDGAKNQPVESCVVEMSPVQDLSNGDPSPDNICPISGWSQVTVTLNDTAHTISLPSTVYGGTQEIVSGEGSATWGIKVFDGTETWVSQGALTNTKHYSCDISGIASSPGAYSADVIGDSLPTIADNSNVIHMNHRNDAVHVWIPADITPQDYFAENPLTVVYPLATPTPITTDPVTDMVTLDGDNTLFTDADELTVTYHQKVS